VLSIVAWNAHKLSAAKLTHPTMGIGRFTYQQYDIINLSETGTEEGSSIYTSHFPHHTAFHIHSRAQPISSLDFRSGISILVARQYGCFHKPVVGGCQCWRCVDTCGKGVSPISHSRNLLMCACYISPSSSAQLQPSAAHLLLDRFDSLLQYTTQATASRFTF
jgi:hypothetical protein